ncbi:MAG: hypothetical protein J5950_04340 [Clostridia bacterium]|nr:hypothetical protein [Clostridia bacterium]
MKAIFAYDLGTGGMKAVALDFGLRVLGSCYAPINTYVNGPGLTEQRPAEWATVFSKLTAELIRLAGIEPAAIAISGHSMGVVPVFTDGRDTRDLLTPIWSDRRATKQAEAFFRRFDRDAWYRITGCGLAPELYSVFKLMWFKKHAPELYEGAELFIGSKDYLNYMLTGVVVTDRSYASGSGVYDLHTHDYSEKLIEAAGLRRSIFPPLIKGSDFVGVTAGSFGRAAGLPDGIPVFAGGVDNVCSTLGARGNTFISLGSSAQLVRLTEEPLLDLEAGAFVWDTGTDKGYASQFGTLAACTALRWAADTLFPELERSYSEFDKLAAQAEPGAGGVVFVPDILASGGGSFAGLTSRTKRPDIARSVLEGIAFSILSAGSNAAGTDSCRAFENVRITVCGGGAKSDVWMKIFADIFGTEIIVPADAGNVAAIGAGMLARAGLERTAGKSDIIDHDHRPEKSFGQVRTFLPDAHNHKVYSDLFKRYIENEKRTH